MDPSKRDKLIALDFSRFVCWIRILTSVFYGRLCKYHEKCKFGFRSKRRAKFKYTLFMIFAPCPVKRMLKKLTLKMEIKIECFPVSPVKYGVYRSTWWNESESRGIPISKSQQWKQRLHKLCLPNQFLNPHQHKESVWHESEIERNPHK